MVLAAVSENGRALRFAADELRNDRRIVLEAAKQDGRAFLYASDELQTDREVIQLGLEHYDKDGSSKSTIEDIAKEAEYGREVVRWAASQGRLEDLSFSEVNAIFMSYPTEKPDEKFPNLGWKFREELEDDPSSKRQKVV